MPPNPRFRSFFFQEWGHVSAGQRGYGQTVHAAVGGGKVYSFGAKICTPSRTIFAFPQVRGYKRVDDLKFRWRKMRVLCKIKPQVRGGKTDVNKGFDLKEI